MLAILRKLAFRRRKCATDFARREDGAAALEFALVAAPFIALLLAGLQTALAFFAGQVLESAVADSSREILTGSAQNAGRARPTSLPRSATRCRRSSAAAG